MNNAVFITARTDSSRLPKKIFAELSWNCPVYKFIINRAKTSLAKEVIFCTTNRTEDDALAFAAREQGIRVFRGNCDDKIERWLSAAKTFDIDYFVNYDGDDVFTSVELINSALDILENTDYEYVKAPKNIVTGAFTFGIKTSVLEQINKRKNRVVEIAPSLFTGLKEIELPVIPEYLDKEIRLTLDYKEDLTLFSEIYNKMLERDFNFSTYKIIKYLEENKELSNINWFREKDFIDNQKRILEGR